MKSPKNPSSTNKRLSEGNKPTKGTFRLKATTFFLTYKGSSDSGQKISKQQLANYLLNQNPNDRKLRPTKYLVCEQTYEDGTPHFHVVLVYQKRKPIQTQAFFDYRGIHPNIQTMRNMKAALQYVSKEDKEPLTNMDLSQEHRVAKVKDTSSLYGFLQQQMMKDPFNFDPIKYCLDYKITRQIYKANYSKALKLLRDVQPVYCNKLLSQKRGFCYISRALIQSKLSVQELCTFDSWGGYQIIVNYLNQIVTYGCNRPFKSKQLLLVGKPNTGKTSLVRKIQQYCATYHLDVSNWFPNYRDGVYSLFFWDQFKLKGGMSHTDLLKFLQGSPMDLQYKGGSSLRMDNQLIIMTSNLSLQSHIDLKFKDPMLNLQAKSNLGTRIQEVVIPETFDLFLLLSLIYR